MKIWANWKTTLGGLGMIAWASLDAWHAGHISDADQTAFMAGVTAIFAKDFDK